jgi:hypothetical protein
MAVQIQQLSVDSSLIGFTNYAGFYEYLITGTYYILDTIGQMVYVLPTPGVGVLQPTGGGYNQFLALLAAAGITVAPYSPNAPTAPSNLPFVAASIPAPATPVANQEDSFFHQEALYILKAIHAAVVSLATQGNLYQTLDFEPGIQPGASDNTLTTYTQ